VKTKIEWCDTVWNPAWGCLNTCEYCYARKMAWRFGPRVVENDWSQNGNGNHNDFDKFHDKVVNFKPTWLESNFNKKFPKKPSRIFVNSMSDIAYWEPEWMEKVIYTAVLNPQHMFIFLTKNPNVYYHNNFPSNCLLGITITNQTYVTIHNKFIYDYQGSNNKTFISLEPIQEKIELFSVPNWLIIGAETGNRKNKIIPKKEWIEEFRNIDIPVFMKNNLKDIVGDNLRQEFPK
jgi:protein gp37